MARRTRRLMASCNLHSAVACAAILSRAQGSCSTSVNSLAGWSRSNWRSDALVWDVLRLSSNQDNRVLRFSTRAQNDPQYFVSDASNQEAEPQIIVPNVNTSDYLYGEKEMLKSVDEDAGDTSEAEEVSHLLFSTCERNIFQNVSYQLKMFHVMHSVAVFIEFHINVHISLAVC